ncbi:MAG: hypothetical protein ABEK12_02695, partial [Candidatus Nanohaloarchaea archaeon]
ELLLLNFASICFYMIATEPSEGWSAAELADTFYVEERHPDHAGPITTTYDDAVYCLPSLPTDGELGTAEKQLMVEVRDSYPVISGDIKMPYKEVSADALESVRYVYADDIDVVSDEEWNSAERTALLTAGASAAARFDGIAQGIGNRTESLLAENDVSPLEANVDA